MKKLSYLFVILFWLCVTSAFSQNSWINVQLLTDDYPTETSWQITPPGGSPIIAQSDSNLLPNTLYSDTISLGGTIITAIFDSFGDGLGSSQWGGTDGWFLIQNDCQDTIMYVAGNFGEIYTDTLIIAPCAPPIVINGCTDPIAQNFDPLANSDNESCEYIEGCKNPNAVNFDSTAQVENGSCLYSVEFMVDMNIYPDTFSVPYVAGEFNNWTDEHPMLDPDGDNIWEITINIPAGQYVWKYMLDNWANQELPQLGPNSICFQPDGLGFINRTLNVINESIQLPLVCWESCLPCGAILGCTDSSAINFNPWANLDNGTCELIASCGPGQTPIDIIVAPDNYGSELSWKLFGDYGLVAEAPQGTYSGAQPGLPISTFACVDTGQLYDLVIEDSYGDGLCGTCFGGTTNGNVVVIDCEENILYNLQDEFPDGNFNFLATSPQFGPSTCEIITLVGGCTNPLSTTFNPEADFDDGSCGPPREVGCTDSLAFNYDPAANTSEIILGQYTLEIFDGASDGWGGTWLGLIQGDWISPQYKMGANDGNTILFQVSLNIYEPVYAYLFVTPQSISSIDQIAYKLTGPEGDVIIDVIYWDAIPFPFILEANNLPTFGNVCVPKILGCTDPTAFNFIQLTGDSLIDVNTDDGSCEAVIVGCMNPIAFNFDSTANVNDNDLCVAEVIGCTDPTAFNFNSSANVNDPSACVPVIEGCTDDGKFNYDASANTDDGSCIPFIYGCIDANALNYDINANTDNGSCIAVVLGCTDVGAFNFNVNANVDDNSCVPKVFGCTDPTALNFNIDANVNIGCIYPVLGCIDPTAFNFNVNANTDDGSCMPVVIGCTDITALNFDLTANTNSGCIYPILGCTDPAAFNYDINANTDDNSCIDVVIGCTDATALNYNILANTNNGCIYPVLGCTDVDAFNFDPLANTDDGSCVDFLYGCTDPTAFNYDINANTDNGSCISYIYGCTDSTAFNYNSNANTDNGSCIDVLLGCTDNTALNFNPLANTLDNSCCYIGGCTDPAAVNYNENACYDDNSCITAVPGCTDVSAYNYNPAANVTDSLACLYDAGCYGGPGVPYWLNDGCFAWVIDVDDYCCNNEWDATCQSMYDYCQLGWPTDIEDVATLGIAVYPNPTRNVLTIETRLDIKVELYDLMGRLLINSTETRRLDLSDLPNGLYNLSITHENKRYSKQIVKQ